MDALDTPRDKDLVYAFPPFTLLATFLAKVEEEGVEDILVGPFWTTQICVLQLGRTAD